MAWWRGSRFLQILTQPQQPDSSKRTGDQVALQSQPDLTHSVSCTPASVQESSLDSSLPADDGVPERYPTMHVRFTQRRSMRLAGQVPQQLANTAAPNP